MVSSVTCLETKGNATKKPLPSTKRPLSSIRSLETVGNRFDTDDKAVEAYTQAARLYEGLEDMQETADCYSNIGDLEFKASSVTKACEALKNSAQIYLKQGKPGDVGL